MCCHFEEDPEELVVDRKGRGVREKKKVGLGGKMDLAHSENKTTCFKNFVSFCRKQLLSRLLFAGEEN